jgi:hypothetical protein
MKILTDLDFTINRAEIKKRLGFSSDSQNWKHVQDLVQEVGPLIKPKCAYEACYIQEKTEETVGVEGVQFKSKVLSKNLEDVERIFPFVITIGPELEEKYRAEEDFLEQYYLDTIANVALQDLMKSMCAYLQEEYKLEKLSYMNPGSLQDWPIQEQRKLFSLLGNVQEGIGVRLASSMLMHPAKSESGIFFPTEVTFFNCQLCPREGCSSRKAAFDENLAREYGVLERE